MYGQFDFMNSEAGEKLVKLLNENKVGAKYYEISEGGHNLYIDNPFDTNQKYLRLFCKMLPKLTTMTRNHLFI